MRKLLAITLAKEASFWSRLFGAGGGGALPGLIAEKIYPNIIPNLSAKLTKGLVFVTGTNGKTTTSKLITEMLEAAGLKVINNYGGSNLSRGLASILVEKSRWFGLKMKGDIGVYEIDEATMPQVTSLIKPNIIVVTNIFRDQLDRYGEVDKTASIIAQAISQAPDSLLVLNGDDPMVAFLGSKSQNVTFFGIEDTSIAAKSDMAIDTKDCLNCGGPLTYNIRYYGHVGVYKCSSCAFSRPAVHMLATGVKISGEQINATIKTDKESIVTTFPLTGLYNLYNVLAALQTSRILGVSTSRSIEVAGNFSAAFGRMEKFTYEGKQGTIHLIKNPTGFNQVLEATSNDKSPKTVLVALNDNFADGTDISWIWDSEIELLSTSGKIILSGQRAEDLRLRFKYAGFHDENLIVEKDLQKALSTASSQTSAGSKMLILPTYTAMLALRQLLVSKGALTNYWK